MGSDVTRQPSDPPRPGRQALDELVPPLYDELKRLAHDRLRRERPDHSLNTTALVHEAYLKLLGVNRVTWQDRPHFLAMASRTMRRVLIDYARGRQAAKRGGGRQRVELNEARLVADAEAERILRLHEALVLLDDINPRQREILEQRYFGGMTIHDTAAALGISPTTVKRELRFARAWLASELSDEPVG